MEHGKPAHAHAAHGGHKPPAAAAAVSSRSAALDRMLCARQSVDKRRRGLKRVSTLKLLPSRLLSRIYGTVNRLPL
jgi:hypothetical protein